MLCHAMPCQTTVSTTPVDTVQCCRPFPLEQTNLCPSLWRQSTDIQTRASAPSPSPSSSQEPDDRILDAPPSPIIHPDPIVIDALMICRADSVVAGPGSRLRRRPSNNVARVASLSLRLAAISVSPTTPHIIIASHAHRIAARRRSFRTLGSATTPTQLKPCCWGLVGWTGLSEGGAAAWT
ncbi:hypothetical protein M430DRAFT_244523 [Amorphotheca resinae ATCC 22711]|uniref:Uncharacterized protein n=1 Tax=Amorphotheca resinae ATCC 22711 TaxID=857342 RepID=A0A2T3B2R3_AMORE|nr:hypothetical protein M430DRAFT_244523 [Amorphotheca resinae ATCC 22711]PSS18848.1 hypothetical protein M430DRAFT_244523 [Amorphotheca resinae ATCC 22711]